jgi:hypothetical protein
MGALISLYQCWQDAVFLEGTAGIAFEKDYKIGGAYDYWIKS